MGFTFTPTAIPDVVIVTPTVFGDDRGFFMETYKKEEFHEAGITAEFVQDNHSTSKKGVLRWLHFQTQNTQAKLVRVISGSVIDVAVDLRKKSSTYGKHVAVELSAHNKQQLFVPQGCAHGFLTLEDDTEFVYKCDNNYSPTFDNGIHYNDPTIGIDWHTIQRTHDIVELFLSEKDQKLPSFATYDCNPFFL